jgi:hypothetical protein
MIDFKQKLAAFDGSVNVLIRNDQRIPDVYPFTVLDNFLG